MKARFNHRWTQMNTDSSVSDNSAGSRTAGGAKLPLSRARRFRALPAPLVSSSVSGAVEFLGTDSRVEADSPLTPPWRGTGEAFLLSARTVPLLGGARGGFPDSQLSRVPLFGLRPPVSICVHLWLKRMGLLLMCLWLGALSADAHHFKGLPHYNYYENYPQVPEEEFLGPAGEYELSLVVYDFQGINKEKVESPDNVRLFLLIFNLLDNRIYQGPLTVEVMDGDRVAQSVKFDSADLENIYSLHRELPDTGKYSIRVTLHGENDLQCEIAFQLSSQKIHWGRWIGLTLFVLIGVSAIGARKARVSLDRKEARQQTRAKEKSAATSPQTPSYWSRVMSFKLKLMMRMCMLRWYIVSRVWMALTASWPHPVGSCIGRSTTIPGWGIPSRPRSGEVLRYRVGFRGMTEGRHHDSATFLERSGGSRSGLPRVARKSDSRGGAATGPHGDRWLVRVSTDRVTFARRHRRATGTGRRLL